MLDFASGKLSTEDYRARCLAATNEQLALLMNDPKFHAWQQQKAARENRARALTNLLAVAGCVLLVVTMALLKPAASGHPATLPVQIVVSAPVTSSVATPVPATAAAATAATPATDSTHTTAAVDAAAAPVAPTADLLESDEAFRALQAVTRSLEQAREEKEAAMNEINDLSLQLRIAQRDRDATTDDLHHLHAKLEAAARAEEDKAAAAQDLVSRMVVRLAELEAEVVAAEAAAAAAAAEAAATAAAMEAAQAVTAAALTAAEARAADASSASLAWHPAEELRPGACPSHSLAALLPRPLPVCSTKAASRAAAVAQPTNPGAAAAAPAPTPPPALYTFLAAVVCTALAVAGHLRQRRAFATEAARAVALAARLKETSFAKDTAEQSLALLETELQHRMKQLEEVQQRAAAASSPRIGASPQLPPMHTPERGELPPPPASLIEKFLLDHNYLAVQHDQMEEWLKMEQQFKKQQAMLEELQASLAEKDAQIAEYEAELEALGEQEQGSLQRELRTRDGQLAQVRAWLDEAQEELLNTQAALQEQEAECRRVTSQLQALQLAVGDTAAQGPAPGSEEGGNGTNSGNTTAALVQQNLELMQQLQDMTVAYEELQSQLSAAATASPGGILLALGERPASAASTLPGTPMADLSREVESCLEMMRATRAQLADRLAHSQVTCDAIMAASSASAGATASTMTADEEQEEEAEKPPAAFGSPALGSPAFSERHAGEEQAASVPEEVTVLGESRRHHINLQHLQQTPSPAKKAASGAEGSPVWRHSSPRGDGSMRKAWEEAHTRVAEVRAQHNNWDVAGFVRQLGFEMEDAGAAPVDRAEFMAVKDRAEAALQAAASTATTAYERALAGEAMQALHDWQWPVHSVNAPPPTSFWRMLGLEA